MDNTYTVSEINNLIRTTLLDTFNNNININGEVSNCKISNNHLFLTLKDENCSINVISWNYTKYKNRIDIDNGDQILIKGKLNFYKKNGNINIIPIQIEKIGMGNLNEKYENIKKKYEDKGYFKLENKKQIPKYIRNIGIITAPEGAAIQDILYVLKEKNFKGNIHIKRTIVQGANCPDSIIDGIRYFNNIQDNIDIILITRGGGSFEDLMGFSDEKVIEEIYKSKVFTLSAVGHEVDNMLSDYVSDMRCPTPSVAAEFIANIQINYYDKLKNIINNNNNIINDIQNKIDIYKYKLNDLQSKIINPIDLIDNQIDKINHIRNNTNQIFIDKINNYNQILNNLEMNVNNFNIDKMLINGYSILNKNGLIYDSIDDINTNDTLNIKLKDGELDIIVKNIIKN